MKTTRRRRLNSKGKIALFVLILIIFYIPSFIAWNIIVDKSQEIYHIQNEINALKEQSDMILKHIDDIHKAKQDIDVENEEMVKHLTNISEIRNMQYSTYSDLSNKDIELTEYEMNKIISYWADNAEVKSKFIGKGKVFIEASKRTGLNPVYILAHAAVESAWGTSYIARNKHNYFGINCVDWNPDKGYIMGDSVDEGIMNGAIWIAKHYYNNGYTTLRSMKDANYATDPNWPHVISSIMNRSMKAL